MQHTPEHPGEIDVLILRASLPLDFWDRAILELLFLIHFLMVNSAIETPLLFVNAASPLTSPL